MLLVMQPWPALGVCLSLLWSTPILAKTDAAPIVAAFRVQDTRPPAERLTPRQLDGMTIYLASLLAQNNAFRVVPQPDLKEAIASKKAESYDACYDETCQIEIGKSVAAQKILTTKIIHLGSRCVLTATIYDLEKEVTEGSASQKAACDPDALGTALEHMVASLKSHLHPHRTADVQKQGTTVKVPGIGQLRAGELHTFAAFGGTPTEWAAFKEKAKRQVSHTKYLGYLGSGQPYADWAAEQNSESSWLEYTKWGTAGGALFYGLIGIGLRTSSDDRFDTASSATLGMGAFLAVIAGGLFVVDALDIGSVPSAIKR